jgi:hypothetical protein
MDRSMKSPAKGSSKLSSSEWEALLARIQSPSKELEASLAKSNSNLIEALSGLEELEKLTRTHLAVHLAPQVPVSASANAPALSSHPVQTQTQATEVKYQTSREEYAPALNQSALVEALLQYQRKKALRAPKPAPSAGKSRSTPPTQDIDTPAFSRSEFVPMKIPAIDAEPKAAPLGRATAPSVRLPVLRTTKPNPTGNSDDQEN